MEAAADAQTAGVVIVNYHSSVLVERCIAGLSSPAITVVLVQDNSDDPHELARLERIASAEPRMRIRRSPGNVGFGKAVNLGVAAILESPDSPAHVWILNPDTVPTPNAIALILAQAEGITGGVFSPILTTHLSGREKIWFAGGSIDWSAGRVSHQSYGQPVMPPSQAGEPYRTGFLSGASLVMSADTWSRSGGMREDLFLYWEDVEYSQRCIGRGIGLWVVPEARVWHQEGGTSASGSGKSSIYYRYNARNRLIICSEETGCATLLRPRHLRETAAYLLRPLAHESKNRWLKLAAAAQGTLDAICTIARSLIPGMRPVGRPDDCKSIGQEAASILAKQMSEIHTQHRGFTATWLNHVSIMSADWDALRKFDYIGVDGTLLQLLLRASGIQVKRTSADLTLPALLEFSRANGRRIGFVGAKAGVAALAARRFVGVNFVADGYAELATIRTNPSQLRTAVDVVVLGLGARLQDQVATQLATSMPHAAIVTAGGWIDQMAKSADYFPAWIHKMRLGWLWRLAHEPRRLLKRYTILAVLAIRNRRLLVDRIAALGLHESELGFMGPRFRRIIDQVDSSLEYR